jgi:LPS sulfotransferase NodH
MLTVLTTARTGSNYFCDAVDMGFSNINVHYEIYNKDCCYLGRDQSVRNALFATYSRNDLHNVVRDDPVAFVTHLQAACKEDYMLFKLFVDHLSPEHTRALLSQSTRVIVLKRNFLDSFISNEKAKQVGAYSLVSTTNVKITFDTETYRKYKGYYDALYVSYETFLQENKIPHAVVHYTDFCENPTATMQSIFHGLDVRPNPQPGTVTFSKQDTSEDYQDKIDNYQEFLDIFSTEK